MSCYAARFIFQTKFNTPIKNKDSPGHKLQNQLEDITHNYRLNKTLNRELKEYMNQGLLPDQAAKKSLKLLHQTLKTPRNKIK